MSNQEENNVMDFLNTSLERQLNWIAAADSKVPAVFGITDLRISNAKYVTMVPCDHMEARKLWKNADAVPSNC